MADDIWFGIEQWFSKWGARPPGGARTLSRGGAMSQTEKEKKTADLSLVSESSLSGEMQGAGLTQTNQILFCS